MNATAAITVTAINRGMGEIQIHKAGCKDLKRNARGASIWNIEARSQQDVAEDVFADMINEDPEQTWEGYLAELDFCNCCPKLPRTASAPDAPAAAPAQRTRTAQAAIILAFLEAHRGTAYTPHQIAVAMGHKGLRDACKRLAAAGTIEQASDKPVSYRIA